MKSEPNAAKKIRGKGRLLGIERRHAGLEGVRGGKKKKKKKKGIYPEKPSQ